MLLQISRGSVVAAYDHLEGEGYLLSRQGAPTRIHPELTVAPASDSGGTTGISRKVSRTRIS